ncbi:hypothetical protein ACSNOK_19290 [Streptomyces sp. URMC 126]|uniref:hypothetical protein n=1 Tax=Streptomyces sp. URMC 126 TaxID=3423401 RepID=UPI003F1CE7C2
MTTRPLLHPRHPRAAGPHASCLRRALRYEWKRLWSLRSPWILSALVGLIGVGNGIDIGLGEYALPALADVLQFSPLASQAPMSGLLLFILGTTAVSTEYTYRAARTTFLTLSSRRTAYAAKVAVTSATAAAVSLGASLLSAVIGATILAVRGAPQPDWTGLTAPLAVFTVVMLCWPTIATGLTALLRRRVPVIVFLLLWPLILERLTGILLNKLPGLTGLSDHLPFAAARAALHCVRGQDTNEDVPFTEALLGSGVSPALGLAIFCAFTACLAIAGGIAYTRRDV